MATISNNPVVHFEIGCKALAQTTAFYSELFGWTSTSIPFASLLNTNSKEFKGCIQGCVTSLGHEPHNYVTFYIKGDDINGSLQK